MLMNFNCFLNSYCNDVNLVVTVGILRSSACSNIQVVMENLELKRTLSCYC